MIDPSIDTQGIPKAGYPQPKDEVVGVSYQLSALEVILKYENLEVWKRSSRLCADLYKHFLDGYAFTDN